MYIFSGKVALVTGAAGNVGTAVAKAFELAGARLVLVDHAEERLHGLYSESDEAMLLAADLTDEGSVAAMAERTLERFGRVDVLANIAGGFKMGTPLHQTPMEVWDHMLDLNARSVFLTCRALIPHMLEHGGGRIVNVGARAAVQVKGKMAPYCASKAAVVTLTEALAVEHRHDGINVNCVLPGTVDTPQNRADMPEADFHQWVPPEALADVILFLASDAARAVNGVAVPVYGES